MATTPKPNNNIDLEYKIEDKEAFVVYNIFNKVKDAFIKWIGAYFVFVTLAITYAGYKGYQEIIPDIRNHIASISKEKFDTIMGEKLDQEVKKLSNEYRQELKTKLDAVNKNYDTEFAQSMSVSTKQSDSRINDLIKRINENSRSKKIPLVKASIPKSGFLYYGIINNKDWKEINFKNGSHPDQLPVAGDKVTSTVPVNIRDKVILYTKKQGWLNQKIIGTIDQGVTLTIKRVIPVINRPEYIWIEYEQ